MDQEPFDIEDRRHRRIRAIVTGAVILALVAGGWLLYPRLRSLLQPQAQLEKGQTGATNDVVVTLGPLTQALLLSGSLEPERTARLSFAAASGQVAGVYVGPGMAVQEGDLLLELDGPALQRNLAKVRGELLDARTALDKLLADRGLTKRMALEEELRKARTQVEEAQRELDRYVKGRGTPQEDRAKAEADLVAAQEELTSLREGKEYRDALEAQRITADLAEIEHGPLAWIQNPSEEDRDREWLSRIVMLNTREEYNQALLRHDMAIRAAQMKVVLAQRELQRIKDQIAAGSPAVERAKRQATLQQAQGRVQQLQDQLKALDEDAPDPDVAKAQALVVKVEGRVADAEASVQEGALSAPFAGIVGEVRVAPGSSVAPGMELLTLYSATDLRVVVYANEMDVGKLAQGQEVQLSFDAFPGQSVPGTLGEIPRYGTSQNGLTVFKVAVGFTPGEVELRTGMSASASVPLARKESVLQIPAMAVQRDADGTFVLVVTGGKTSRRSIETGISDGIQTEVVSGLEEGETVRVPLMYPIEPRYW